MKNYSKWQYKKRAAGKMSRDVGDEKEEKEEEVEVSVEESVEESGDGVEQESEEDGHE